MPRFLIFNMRTAVSAPVTVRRKTVLATLSTVERTQQAVSVLGPVPFVSCPSQPRPTAT